jgi:amidase
VKDIIETHDMPTHYGSPIHAGHRPSADAACVALAREAGAVMLGKTVTTEFALRHPGPTANPHNPAHTPGDRRAGRRPPSPTSWCRWRSARKRVGRSSVPLRIAA